MTGKRKLAETSSSSSRKTVTKRIKKEVIHCPISLEQLTSTSVVFTHEGVRFDAKTLYDFIQSSASASNPVNRKPFTDQDLTALSALLKLDALPTGSERLACAAAQKDRQEWESELLEDSRSILHGMFDTWSLCDYEFQDLHIDAVDTLQQIKNDTLGLEGGRTLWNTIYSMLWKEYKSHVDAFDVLEAVGDVRDEVPQYTEQSPIVAAAAAAPQQILTYPIIDPYFNRLHYGDEASTDSDSSV